MASGATFWSAEVYDAVILDLGLLKIDGLTLLERWRGGGIAVPVLVLTARGSWSEKVRGIDGGADDYLTKPFEMAELLARLRALIRRSSGQLTPELRSGALLLDPRTSQVTLDGQPVKLTSHELRVLSYLMHHRGRVVSQSELTEHIYAQTFDCDSNTRRSVHRTSSAEARRRDDRDRTRPRISHSDGIVTGSLRTRLLVGAAVWMTAVLVAVIAGVVRLTRNHPDIALRHATHITMGIFLAAFLLGGLFLVRKALAPFRTFAPVCLR